MILDFITSSLHPACNGCNYMRLHPYYMQTKMLMQTRSDDEPDHHLEPRFSVYAWYIPCISQTYASGNVTNMSGLYVVYPCIYMVYPRGQCRGYTWYIQGYTMYIHEDIHGISLYIHGISEDVYTWYIRGISMYIPGFVCLDFWAGPCCWSQSMRTLVLVIKIGLFHAPPWQLCHWKRRQTKGSS